MQFTLQEAARYLGKSERQIRYLIKNEKIPAKKLNGRYYIQKEALPQSEGQQSAANRKAQQFDQLAAEIVGQDTAQKATKRYTVRHLRIFETGRTMYLKLSKERGPADAVVDAIKQALLALTEGCHVYHRADKVRLLNQARSHVCQAAALLYLEEQPSPLAEQLERELLPGFSAFIKRIERKVNR